jgi:GT2 family glycosyltransferase/glycosyltransferase involved in cell wall biosynthesis
MSRQDAGSLEEQLKAAQRRVGELEIELQSLHTRLHQITTGRTWAVIAFFHRVRYWLWIGPAEQRRQKAREFAKRMLRRTHLYPLAAWGWRRARRIKQGVTRQIAAGGVAPKSAAEILADDVPQGYDVICLPVILWNSRFQRPQQLMEQYARRGHRVFYASLGFCGGKSVQLSRQRPGVFEMTLPGPPGVNVYRELPSEGDVARMADAIDRLRAEGRLSSAIVVVQLPFWTALAEKLRERLGWPIVYDCMDDHAGFSTNCEAMLRTEDRTISESDLVVVTSDVLDAKVRAKARRTTLIRNACDYEHFAAVGDSENIGADRLAAAGTAACDTSGAAVPAAAKQSAASRAAEHPTVGFYGAIAEWFDADLVADLAESRPGWRFELIGSTHTGDVSRLERLPNVTLYGEKPYAELPRLVAGWDCFLIPFKRIPLTEATNPVKAYEMLATGKPVVAVNLPELRPMAHDGLLSLADDASGFARAIEYALAEDDDRQRQRRRAFAAQNTWSDRCDAFDAAARELFPPASIIIVTYNNLALTQMCLESVFRETDYPNYEVIAVDNASHDGAAEWLVEAAMHEPRLRVIRNADNRGFSGANNQGLRAARGQFLCLLNNDTVATRGWLSTMIGHLRTMPGVGMVGPVSNMVGNEAKIPVGYTAIEEMPRWAAEYCRQHDGETFAMKMLGFFCVLLRREVYEKVGEMDEQFGVGYFEDTDYCCRTARAGYELRCARDSFVHHWQGASFRLLGTESHAHIYQQNQRLFESKWGADSMAGAY